MTCSYTTADGVRCTEPATRQFLCDGKRISEKWMCRHHAEAVLAEYRAHADIIDGVWTSEPVDQYGTRVEAAPMQGELGL